MRLRDGLRGTRRWRTSRGNTISQHLRRRTCRWPLLSPQSDVHLGRMDTALYAMPMHVLLERIQGPESRPSASRSKCTTRFAYPAACLVLMLLGVPLGVVSRRGGKSGGSFSPSAGDACTTCSRIPALRWATGAVCRRSGGVAGEHSFCRGRHHFCCGRWRAEAAC